MNPAMQAIATRLPRSVQQEINRLRHRAQIRRGAFVDTEDPFFETLPELVFPGSWAIDVGANVGHYALRMSDLVGPTGRVVAIEPIPDTFELLAANARRANHANITLVNAACSDRASEVRMSVPVRASGLPNPYEARIADDAPLAVLCITLDGLGLTQGVSLLKTDAEGHDFAILRGASEIIERHRPAILTEGSTPEMEAWLGERGYERRHAKRRCPNRLFVHHHHPGSEV